MACYHPVNLSTSVCCTAASFEMNFLFCVIQIFCHSLCNTTCTLLILRLGPIYQLIATYRFLLIPVLTRCTLFTYILSWLQHPIFNMLSDREEELRYDPNRELSFDDAPLDDNNMSANDMDPGAFSNLHFDYH